MNVNEKDDGFATHAHAHTHRMQTLAQCKLYTQHTHTHMCILKLEYPIYHGNVLLLRIGRFFGFFTLFLGARPLRLFGRTLFGFGDDFLGAIAVGPLNTRLHNKWEKQKTNRFILYIAADDLLAK